MQISITENLGNEPERYAFVSSVGRGIGVWCGDGPPVVGGYYDVELEVPEDVVDWRRVRTGTPLGFVVRPEGGMSISAELEIVGRGETPFVTMRLGVGILSFEAARFDELAAGEVIEVETAWLYLWPFSY
jgi:hypothetical protein